MILRLLLAFGFVQDPTEPPTREEPRPVESAPRDPWLDFGRLELNLQMGSVQFSRDFDADPELCLGALGRVPMPRLSEIESDLFGLFAQATFSSIDRHVDPPPGTTDGSLFFFAAGIDMLFLKSEETFIRGQVGLQYGFFSGVDDLENGVAILAGVVGGLRFSDRVWVTVDSQFAFADAGDRLWFNQFGLLYRF